MRWPWLLPALLAACFTDSPTTGAMCEPGASGCPCEPGSTCSGTLNCTDGYCVDPNCGEGTPECPCYGNDTCDPGLECVDGAICQPIEGTGSAPTSSPPTTSASGSGGSEDSATSLPTTTSSSCDGCPTGHCDDQGRCARWVFVTEAVYTTGLGGLGGADDKCNEEASKGVVGDATFAAFLRDGMRTAPDNAQISTDEDSVFLLPGDSPIIVATSPVPFALGNGDLHLENPINRNATGEPAVGRSDDCGTDAVNDRVFTGYERDDGDGLMPGGTCGGWGGTMTGGAGTGRFGEVTLDWVAFDPECECRYGDGPTGSSNLAEAHLYCVEVPSD